MAERYTCAMCHRTFEKFVTDAVANAEAEELWGVSNASDRPDFRVVCDDCWQNINPADHPEQYAKALAELKQQ